jgi:hypothetical protein
VYYFERTAPHEEDAMTKRPTWIAAAAVGAGTLALLAGSASSGPAPLVPLVVTCDLGGDTVATSWPKGTRLIEVVYDVTEYPIFSGYLTKNNRLKLWSTPTPSPETVTAVSAIALSRTFSQLDSVNGVPCTSP